MKRCPICDELIEEHLQVCPYCDEETGFEAETISKKVCPVCGELIDETLLVCPVCGEDISPQTNSEHTSESVVEEPEPMQEPEPETICKKECPVCGELIDEALIVCPICGEDITPQTSSDQAPEVAEESVVIPQPEPVLESEPIVEEPQPVQESVQEPEPEVAPEPVVIPQPELEVEPEPIVEEPQPDTAGSGYFVITKYPDTAVTWSRWGQRNHHAHYNTLKPRIPARLNVSN